MPSWLGLPDGRKCEPRPLHVPRKPLDGGPAAREDLDDRHVDRAKHEGELECVARTENPPKRWRLPLEEVDEGARPPSNVRRGQLEARPAEDEVRPGRDPNVGGIHLLAPFAAGDSIGRDHLSGVHVRRRVGDPPLHPLLVQRHQCRIAQTEQCQLVTVGPDQEVDAGS